MPAEIIGRITGVQVQRDVITRAGIENDDRRVRAPRVLRDVPRVRAAKEQRVADAKPSHCVSTVWSVEG